MSVLTNFRIQIKTLMKEKGVSAAKLSRLADISPNTLYSFLDGRSKRGITSGNLEKLFDVLMDIKT